MQAAQASHRPSSGERPELAEATRVHLGAIVMAACITGSFLATGGGASLPALPYVAAFLLLAIHQDLAARRIPNWLTLPALAIALVLAFAGITVGAGSAALGVALALVVGFVLFSLGALGAGDVKATMVLGALWGPGILAAAALWTLLAGGLMALLLLVVRGGLPDLSSRWWRSLVLTLRTGRIHYFAPAEASVARMGLPFAVAMGLGCAALHAWGTPWS